MERREIELDTVNEAIEAVLDGTAGAARSVFRMEPVEVARAGRQALATA